MSAALSLDDVKSRADVLAGRAFGTAGAYEKLSGTIYFAIPASKLADGHPVATTWSAILCEAVIQCAQVDAYLLVELSLCNENAPKAYIVNTINA